MEQIQADLAWQITTGSHDIMVGVMDSGADYTHPALDGNIDETLGINFLYFNPFWWYETPVPIDDYGHGTHESGIIGAVGGNGEGVIGVSQNVTIVPLKIWDSVGQGSVAEFIAAMV
jgi:subtilisin family serine protease